VNTSERDALIFHALFLTAAAALVLVEIDAVALGVRILILVVGYNLALPLVAKWRGHALWMRIWAFVLPISVLQIYPDWFLVDVVGSLSFDVPGVVAMGPVPGYMGLMWSIPLFAVVFVGERVESWREGRGLHAAVLTGVAFFAGAEALLPVLEIWQPVDVTLVAGIAVYILPAEAVLSAVTYVAWKQTRERGLSARIAAALVVMFCYLGAASAFYLAVEIA
jgi:hypothetical protein